MKKNPIWFLIIGIIILIVPTVVYLIFLIPQMKEEYIVLMSSGGAITGSGLSAANLIPEKMKSSKLLKLSAKSFTLLTALTLVQEFLMQIIGLIAVFIISFIIFSIFKGAYINARRRKENTELAKEVARTVTKIA